MFVRNVADDRAQRSVRTCAILRTIVHNIADEETKRENMKLNGEVKKRAGRKIINDGFIKNICL